MKGGYIIWDTKTGIYDGAYADFNMANDRYIRMKEADPSGEWVIVQWVDGKRLANEKFHARQKVKE